MCMSLSGLFCPTSRQLEDPYSAGVKNKRKKKRIEKTFRDSTTSVLSTYINYKAYNII